MSQTCDTVCTDIPPSHFFVSDRALAHQCMEYVYHQYPNKIKQAMHGVRKVDEVLSATWKVSCSSFLSSIPVMIHKGSRSCILRSDQTDLDPTRNLNLLPTNACSVRYASKSSCDTTYYPHPSPTSSTFRTDVLSTPPARTGRFTTRPGETKQLLSSLRSNKRVPRDCKR